MGIKIIVKNNTKGYASSASKTIFYDLYSKGIRRLDTDTADGNIIAQKL